MTCTTAKIHLISGPTASGKSALALEWARHHQGIILNADSMQLYVDLPILTARPSVDEMTQCPHHLYGHLSPTETFSVGAWVRAAIPYIEAALNAGAPLCIVGGTGLYFSALIKGLADIPAVSREARNASEALFLKHGEHAFREAIKRFDATAEARIKPNDRQRLVRAHAVFTQSGKSLSQWQENTHPVLHETQYSLQLLQPPREVLYARIADRFHHMIDLGALDEVEALIKAGLQSDWPIMRVLGLTEAVSYLKGEVTKPAFIEKAIIATRHYAKRQMTWLRNQF